MWRGRRAKAGVHSIQTKMMGVSLLVAVGTAVVSLLISYYAEIRTIQGTTEKYMEQYISFADQQFNNMLKESKKIILTVAMAQEVISPNLVEAGQEAEYDAFQKKKQVRGFLSGLLSQKDYIEDVMLVMEGNEVYQAGAGLTLKKELETPLMKQAMSGRVLQMIYDAPARTLFLSRPVSYQNGDAKGTVIMRLNYDYMTSVYHIEPLHSVAICLYLPDGQLFHTSNAVDGDHEGLWEDVRSGEHSTGYVKWGREKQYYIRYVSDISGMMMISMIPQSTLLQDAGRLKSKFLVIGLGASCAAVCAAAYLSKKMCASIRSLSSGMEAVRAGDLSVRMDIKVPDEIGHLADTFNVMMDRIEGLMREVKEKEKMKREAEQDVLASQIEPHFLYNSIDSIQYVAHMRKEQEIENVASALSELLRSVLSNHNEFITLWEERDYIENYLTIERFKYRNSFTVVWDVDEELWGYPVPKLLLQPVVENALIHGIAAKPEDGIINIKIYKQVHEIICKVMDNGKGMSEDMIQMLMSDTEHRNKSGFRRIGIGNVFNRVKLIYGDGCGGRIYSCEGMFTCVELHLPWQKGEKDDSITG